MQDAIAKATRVCVYDRAGYFARSSPAPAGGDAGEAADDLAAMLRAAGEKGPYILAGHSYGGYVVRLFAYRHPSDVAGMVLVDPSSEYQDDLLPPGTPADIAAGLARNAKYNRCSIEPRPTDNAAACILRSPPGDLPSGLVSWFTSSQDTAYAATLVREERAMNTTSSAQLVAERKSLGAIPVIALEQDSGKQTQNPQSSEAKAAADAFGRSWHSLHMVTSAGISSSFELRPVPGAGHSIQNDRPDAVIGAVLEVVERVRERP